MVKILLIIPYRAVEEQTLRQLRQIKSKDIAIETIHIFGTEPSVIREHDPDIIVARGMTGAALREHFPEKHMVEISMTSFDIISAIAESKRLYTPDRVALCIHKGALLDTDVLSELSGLDICMFDVADETDVENAIQRGITDGVQVFIGGLTICQQCRLLKLNNVHIKTSEMAIKKAIDEAVSTAHAINQERARTILFQSVLNNAPDAILSVNSEGKVTALNNHAYKVFRIPITQNILGERLDIYCKGIAWQNTVHTGKPSEALLEISGSLLFVRCSPIAVDDKCAGALITILAADKIQAAETKIRKELSAKGLTARYSFNDIIGVSETMKNNIFTAHKYAQVDANVLLMGETGTGKELFAHSIHMASKRKNEPFVAVNCAALPENLLESELFGYVEGAFSGAIKGGKTGLFEQAHKGTIFLDEIGEIPISFQVKLLRVLQEKEVRRVGDDRVYPVDVRVISATNITIQEQIAAKSFRSDLYYRLNLLSIQLSPLRECKEDILSIADHFLCLFARQYGKATPEITDSAQEMLEAYAWPGNSRELRNFCEKLIVLDESGRVDTAKLRLMGLQECAGTDRSLGDGSEIPDKAELLRRLRDRSMTRDELAKAYGISRTTLWRWSKEL